MNDAALMPRMPRYQVVFFDLYGTLIDIRTDERSETAWQALYEKLRGFGVEYESVEALRGRFARLEAGEMLRQANRSTVRDDWREFDILPVYRSLLIDQADEVERILPLPQAAPRTWPDHVRAQDDRRFLPVPFRGKYHARAVAVRLEHERYGFVDRDGAMRSGVVVCGADVRLAAGARV